MRLVPATDRPPVLELVAVKVADAFIRAGRAIHARFAVLPADVEPDEMWARHETWRASLAAFVTWADPLNFSQRKVLAAGIVSRQGYDCYMAILKACDVIITFPSSGTIWNVGQGWSKRRFLSELNRRELEPHYPLERTAPPVLKGRVAESRYARPTRTAQARTAVFARDVLEGQGDRSK